MRRTRSHLVLLAVAATIACGRGGESARQPDEAGDRALIVFNAGSLAGPLRAALDSFALHNAVEVRQENAGSVEVARKLTELHQIPDLVAVADYEVIPRYLMPEYATWYAQFARNRMVLAYTDRSRGAKEMSADSWWRILERPGIEMGRADPSLDPNGYRTLLTLQLAERHYKQPGLYAKIIAAAPARNVRPKEADLVSLLQLGEMDYIWSYESIAQASGLRYVTLPPEIDLSSAADSASYATASVRVKGKTPTDSATIRGAPILYGLTVPTRAPHRAVAERLAAFLLSADGRRILRAAHLDAIENPAILGTGAPASLMKH